MIEKLHGIWIEDFIESTRAYIGFMRLMKDLQSGKINKVTVSHEWLEETI